MLPSPGRRAHRPATCPARRPIRAFVQAFVVGLGCPRKRRVSGSPAVAATRTGRRRAPRRGRFVHSCKHSWSALAPLEFCTPPRLEDPGLNHVARARPARGPGCAHAARLRCPGGLTRTGWARRSPHGDGCFLGPHPVHPVPSCPSCEGSNSRPSAPPPIGAVQPGARPQAHNSLPQAHPALPADGTRSRAPRAV
jgi:hypothetical protein